MLLCFMIINAFALLFPSPTITILKTQVLGNLLHLSSAAGCCQKLSSFRAQLRLQPMVGRCLLVVAIKIYCKTCF